MEVLLDILNGRVVTAIINLMALTGGIYGVVCWLKSQRTDD